MMKRIAICAGSFDPPTDGHINIIQRSLGIFDKVIVAVAVNMSKQPIFSPEDRAAMLKGIFQGNEHVEVDVFEGLLMDYARKRGVFTLLRGIRTMGDYEYESQMALANKTLEPKLETIYMFTEGKYAHLSSSIIKEIIAFGGEGKGMIHPIVERKLKEKLRT